MFHDSTAKPNHGLSIVQFPNTCLDVKMETDTVFKIVATEGITVVTPTVCLHVVVEAKRWGT